MLLGRGEEIAAEDLPREAVSDTLQRLVEHLGASPAVILGRRWDFLAWNPAYVAVFGDPAALPEERRNHIWATFHDPRRRRLFTDWEAGARSSVARFRADSARHVGDGDFEDLIGEMRRTSPEFDAWWSRHEVAPSGQGRKVLRHPTAGTLHFEHAVFKLEETPEQRLILYTALPTAGTPEKLARLMADAGR
jgi:PAS domain-containing protein